MKVRFFSMVMCTLVFVVNVRAQVGISAVLDTIQHSAFNFFWYEANPANGLIKDRNTSGSACSIASVGFGLTAITIGADHGWVSRSAARDRVPMVGRPAACYLGSR